jgi:hypothetical protein
VHTGIEELGRVYQGDLLINSGMPEFAAAARALASVKAAWSDATKAARAEYEAWQKPVATPGALNMSEVILFLRKRLPPEAILTNGAGNFSLWVHRFYQYTGFRTQLGPTSGAMGYGVPTGVAAKLVHPERPVLAFAGDGDFLMTGQELATAAQYDARVIFIVVNNGMYGTIRMHQEKHYPGRVSGTGLRNPDFAALARAYGLHGETVEKTADFEGRLRARVEREDRVAARAQSRSDSVSPRATLSAFAQKHSRTRKARGDRSEANSSSHEPPLLLRRSPLPSLFSPLRHMIRYIKEDEVKQLLTAHKAVELVELALRERAEGRAVDVPRVRTRTPAGILHVMQAAAPVLKLIGYKAYYARSSHVHLFDADSGKPLRSSNQAISAWCAPARRAALRRVISRARMPRSSPCSAPADRRWAARSSVRGAQDTRGQGLQPHRRTCTGFLHAAIGQAGGDHDRGRERGRSRARRRHHQRDHQSRHARAGGCVARGRASTSMRPAPIRSAGAKSTKQRCSAARPSWSTRAPPRATNAATCCRWSKAGTSTGTRCLSSAK